jgi:hypothetical protein
MSKGLGKRQVRILQELARNPDGSFTCDLIRYPDGHNRYSEISSTRRALARLRALKLACHDSWYPGLPGRPVVWQITDPGRDYLRKRYGPLPGD